MRNWEEAKQRIHRCREALVGNEIRALTDNPNIVHPVNGDPGRA